MGLTRRRAIPRGSLAHPGYQLNLAAKCIKRGTIRCFVSGKPSEHETGRFWGGHPLEMRRALRRK